MVSTWSFVKLLTTVALCATTTLGFGFTTSGSSITVTTDSTPALVFVVNSGTGDLTSIKFDGKETQDMGGKFSHIASGIGASCTAVQTGNSNNYIKVTCTASGIIHYYVARYKDPAIHMATYITTEPSIGELRFIARLDDAVITTGPTVSNIDGGTAIEGSDVYSISSQTRSKFYSSVQFINDQVHGSTGSGIGAYFIIPGTGYEKSSGGPFFRDINNQDSGVQETYFYMNSGHTQTESYRTGLFGPYALWFTTGSAPAVFDTSFWDGLSVSGYVNQAGRGRVTGTASGIPSAFSSNIVIGWKNSAAQYWAKGSTSGAFTSPYMLPGTYTQTLYKKELEVATSSVSVSAGGTTTANIASAESTPSTIWQIGDFDGTPTGFLNADKIQTMHPSDSRMSSWGPITYTVGNSISGFPMAIFKDIGAVTINFSLTSAQTGARTLQIGTTLAFAGGRPVVSVGGWTSATPAAPTQPDSRGVTRGTYRGNNILYTYSIPSGYLSTSNTLTVSVASGSSGTTFLSPNVVIDALRLY